MRSDRLTESMKKGEIVVPEWTEENPPSTTVTLEDLILFEDEALKAYSREPDEEALLNNKGIVPRANGLPTEIEELRDFVLQSSEKLRAYLAMVRAMDKINVAKELRDRAVEEGQILAEEVFKAEAKLGEFLVDINLPHEDRKSEWFKNQTSSEESLKSLGITEKQSYEAQRMADYPEVIEEVLQGAKEENEIPCKAEILKRIDGGNPKQRNLKGHEESLEIVRQLKTKGLGRNDKEHQIYVHHLDRICVKLIPRFYKLELSMEELLEKIKFFQEKEDRTFKAISEQKPIKDFLASCFTQDFMAILQAFGFKIEWPEGITLSPRTNRYQRVKAHRKKMGYYRRKRRLFY